MSTYGTGFRFLSVLLICSFVSACVTTRTEKHNQTIKVNTNPVGAQIWLEDGSGQRELGVSPLNFDLAFQVKKSDFNEWWWAASASMALVSATGIGLYSYQDESSVGYQLGLYGGIALLGSLVYCIVGQVRQSQQTLYSDINIGAKHAGYATKNLKLRIPSEQNEIHLLLQVLDSTSIRNPLDLTKASIATGLVVAVFDIQDNTGIAKRSDLVNLTNYLGTLLAQSGKYKTVPRDQLRKRLIETKKKTYKECYNESCQIMLGKALAAQKSLSTTMIRVGSNCAVTSSLLDLKTETAEKGASVKTGCSLDELLGAMEQIVKQLGVAPD